MAGEQILLDPTSEDTGNVELDITDNTAGYWLLSHDYPTPDDEEQWAGSVDTEGDRRASTRPRNRTISMAVRCRQPAGGTPSIGSIVTALQAKIAKLNADGGTVQRILPSGDWIVFDVEAAHIRVPSRQEWVSRQRADCELAFTCRPHGRGVPLATILDDFSDAPTFTENWTFDTGAGTLSASGGQLVPSSTGAKRLHYSAAPYPLYDAQVTMKFTVGTTDTGLVALALRRLGANDELRGRTAGNGLNIAISKLDGGADTILSSTPAFDLATATTYWLRFRIEGNLLTLEAFTSQPLPGVAPAASVTHTLTGADATKFGKGIGGDAGLFLTPSDTNWRYDDFKVEPNVFKETTLPALTATVYGIEGDVPALGELIVSNDQSAQAQKQLIHGLESRDADPAATSTPLLIEAENTGRVTVQGGSTLVAGPAGASGSGSNVLRQGSVNATTFTPYALLLAQHVGLYRLYARVQVPVTNAGSVQLRARWANQGAAIMVANTPVTVDPAWEGTWRLVDLGLLDLRRTLFAVGSSAGSWAAYLEARNADGVTGTDDFDLDYFLLVPVGESWGVLTDSLSIDREANGEGSVRITDTIAQRYSLASVLTGWGEPDSYEGDLLRIPPSGEQDRPCRFVMKFARNPIDTGADAGIDDISAQILWTPRYLAVPAPTT